MRRHTILAILLLAIVLLTIVPAGVALAETGWLFSQSYYSHAEETGHRVAQYASAETPYFTPDPTYMRSAYRQNRSSIRVGGSADHLHVVETWGDGENVRPYGEWQRPYRDGATPYGPWGNARGPWTSPAGGGWVEQGFGQGYGSPAFGPGYGGPGQYWYQGQFLQPGRRGP